MTRILAIESSHQAVSVALCEDSWVCWTEQLPSGHTAGAALAPTVAKGLSSVHWRPGDVELTAVNYGPGSFTGLRVGLATAKAWAFALGGLLVGVTTFEVLARLADPAVSPRWWCVVDAQRGQYFVQLILVDSTGWRAEGETTLLEARQLTSRLRPGDGLTGPVLDQWLLVLEKNATATTTDAVLAEGRAVWAEPERRCPTAAAVAQAALEAHRLGRSDDPRRLSPWYMRPAAAQEKIAGAASRSADNATD